MTTRKAVAAAVRTEDGLVHFFPPPHRHHHIIYALHDKTESELIVAWGEQGFVMSDGTFAGREEAGKAAIEAGQIKALQWPPKLYSEDLW